MDLFLVSQIIGYIDTGLSIISFQQKKMQSILLFGALVNALAGVSNLFVGAYSGAIVCGFATVQTIVAYLFFVNDKKVPLWCLLLFMGGYIGLSTLTFKGLLDLVPCVAALLYCISTVQKNPMNYKLIILVNVTMWLVYELVIPVPNYAMALGYLLKIVSLVIGIIRLIDRKKPADAGE